MDFATSISPRLLELIEQLAQRKLPIAEINRRVGTAAAKRGVPRPSYERVRVLVNEARRLRREPSTAAVESHAGHVHRLRQELGQCQQHAFSRVQTFRP